MSWDLKWKICHSLKWHFYRARNSLGWCIIYRFVDVVGEKKKKLISFKWFVCIWAYPMNFGAMQLIDTIQPNAHAQLPHRNGLNFIRTFDIITTQYFTIEVILIGWITDWIGLDWPLFSLLRFSFHKVRLDRYLYSLLIGRSLTIWMVKLCKSSLNDGV